MSNNTKTSNVAQSQDLNKEQSKVIEVGKFYLIHDRSGIGHPSFVLEKDDLHNRYLIARFDSDKIGEVPKYIRGIRHIKLLSHPTDSKVVNSYVRNRPFLCKRKEIGIPLPGLSLHKDDEYIIRNVQNKKPEYSKSLTKKSHRWTYSVPRTGCDINI